MTLKEAYLEGCGKLAEAGIEEAKLDAWYLLEYDPPKKRQGRGIKLHL